MLDATHGNDTGHGTGHGTGDGQKWSLHDLEYRTEAYIAKREEVHGRTAERLLGLCKANQGFYIKAAQTVASMQMGVPKQVTSKLRVLQDSAPFKELADVLGTFEAEFGASPHELFAEFDEQPFAAASLAQVHKAVTHDGQRVAVKVQHAGLEDLITTDLWAMRTIASIMPFFFEDLELGWLVTEVEENIAKELDFVREGQSAERVAASFADMPHVRIPGIVWASSSRRVLTMEFMDGFSISNEAQLEEQGVDRAQLTKLLLDTFSRMIFCTGFIHCDPHAGNLLVHKNAETGALDLVLLDHGLYRELDDEFRILADPIG